jgi:hypothetical protein
MYKITIAKQKEKEQPDSYAQWTDVYEQVVDDLDVSALVTIINKKAE